MADLSQDASVLLDKLTTLDSSFPSGPVIKAAIAYSLEYTSPMAVNHCLRSALYSVISIRKRPHLAGADPQIIVLACILHDLGWSKHPDIISQDKRFEVDGANAARKWLQEHASPAMSWGQREEQLVWDAIALHTSPSISFHKEAEVAAVSSGILCDFLPYSLLIEEEHERIIKVLPRLNMSGGMMEILCNLCATKPETTYDNFVSAVGITFGMDGKGTGKEDFQRRVEAAAPVNTMFAPLRQLEEKDL